MGWYRSKGALCNLRVAVIAFRAIRDILWCKANAIAAYTGQLALRACWTNDPRAWVGGRAGGGGRVNDGGHAVGGKQIGAATLR